MKKCSYQGSKNKDEILLLALRHSDKKAYAELFRAYYPMLCAYCHKFVSLEDSEEIVQDVLFWLWESRKVLVIEKSLSQYLFKMVYHKAMNRIANELAVHKANTMFFEQTQKMLEEIDLYQFEELQELLRKAIQNLPESYREAFVMHRFQHKNYKEIAELLKVSSKTIDYRIQQALKILRDKLKDYLPLFFLLTSL
ncbi:MAG TPA: RNA polymerase sigma-70 factor [Candidatus Parabacteroides intestinavium]|nr:RNA polymerase sigma-70 factor [Candidatus Parabacteroides intestinavium]